jgi:hypothetical protein
MIELLKIPDRHLNWIDIMILGTKFSKFPIFASFNSLNLQNQ